MRIADVFDVALTNIKNETLLDTEMTTTGLNKKKAKIPIILEVYNIEGNHELFKGLIELQGGIYKLELNETEFGNFHVEYNKSEGKMILREKL